MRASLAIIVLAAACSGRAPRVLLLQPAGAPLEIQQACGLAEVRCSSCHTLERIDNVVHKTASEWAWQVRRMRLMPASGISEADADVIVQCLTWRDPDPKPTADAGVPIDAFLAPPVAADAAPPPVAIDAGAPPD